MTSSCFGRSQLRHSRVYCNTLFLSGRAWFIFILTVWYAGIKAEIMNNPSPPPSFPRNFCFLPYFSTVRTNLSSKSKNPTAGNMVFRWGLWSLLCVCLTISGVTKGPGLGLLHSKPTNVIPFKKSVSSRKKKVFSSRVISWYHRANRVHGWSTRVLDQDCTDLNSDFTYQLCNFGKLL